MTTNIPELWQHQKEMVDKAGDHFALFAEPGTGKSATTIAILRREYDKLSFLMPTLIICPPVVISNWAREFSVWSKINPKQIIQLKGSGKQRAELVRNANPQSILVTNYEALIMPDLYPELKKFLSRSYSCLVLDESHKCKDPSSKRTRKAIELADLCSHRYILTGTPILNNLMDIFSQFRILDRGQRFGSNFLSFRAKFFENKNIGMPRDRYFPNWQPIKDADLKIKELIEPVSQYVDKATCLTLPPLVKKVIEVEMSIEQTRLYKEMRDSLVATINTPTGDKYSVADLAITKALRLQQIASGYLSTTNDKGEVVTVKIKDNPRKEALRQLLEDIVPYHKVLVWAVFQDNYDDIRDVCQNLNIQFSEIHGLIKDKDAEAHRFRADPKCRVLIGHPGSGGIGVNLVEASYMVYYSRNFSLEFDIQSEARNMRGGSDIHEKITRIDLIASGTIDQLVATSLANKIKISDSVLKQKIGEL